MLHQINARLYEVPHCRGLEAERIDLRHPQSVTRVA